MPDTLEAVWKGCIATAIHCEFQERDGRTVLCKTYSSSGERLYFDIQRTADGRQITGVKPERFEVEAAYREPFSAEGREAELKRYRLRSRQFVQADADPRNNFYRLLQPEDGGAVTIHNNSSRAIRLEAGGLRYRVAAGAVEELRPDNRRAREKAPEALLLLDPRSGVNVVGARVRYGGAGWRPACVSVQAGPYSAARTLLIHDAEDLLGRLESWQDFEGMPLLDLLSCTGMGCERWQLRNVSPLPAAVRLSGGETVTLPPGQTIRGDGERLAQASSSTTNCHP